MSTALAAAVAYALVASDQLPLKAAPAANAAVHARLTAGDLLEVRGLRLDHLQVYDHRRERAGYVKASLVRPITLDAAQAPQLLAVLRFLRDAPGMESLGIAYAAAYLKSAPSASNDPGTPEALDALGEMAVRLGERASRNNTNNTNGNAAAQVEAVAAYGVRYVGIEQRGSVQLCWDGDALQRLLVLPTASAAQRARALLALTRPDCLDPSLQPPQRLAEQQRRAVLLDSLTPSAFASLDEGLKNRLRLRRAAAWSATAWLLALREQPVPAVQAAAERARAELADIDKTELNEDDASAYAEAALRVGAVVAAAAVPAPEGRLSVRVRPGDGEQRGQRCIQLVDTQAPAGGAPLAERCTWGVVWTASARASRDGRALALQVQPTETWTELWVWHQAADGWQLDVIPPASLQPELGYAECAGWSPAEGGQLLLAREARAEGRSVRRFEVLSLSTPPALAVQKSAGTPELLAAFTRWADPRWRQGSVSVR